MTALLPWENADRTRIGRLRLRGGTDSPGLRLAVSGRLDRTDLRPPGVPPCAVLIVRHMGDPLPGRMEPRRAGSLDPAWGRAARDRLAGFYGGASRPGRDVVPADAEAVVFTDEGELLASLALDLVRGRVREHWWWRSLGGALSSPLMLAGLLRDRAAWVPAALALLARQDRAAEVVRALSPDEALSVLTAVSWAHDVPAIAASVISPRASLASAQGAASFAPSASAGSGSIYATTNRDTWREHQGTTADETANALEPMVAGALPPWSHWLADGAVPVEFDKAQASLLGVALVLQRRPEVARSTAFAITLRRWWQTPRAGAARVASTREPPFGQRARRTDAVNGSVASMPRGVPPEPMRDTRPPAGAPSCPTGTQKPAQDRAPERFHIGDRDHASQHVPPSAISAPHRVEDGGPVVPTSIPDSTASGSAAEQVSDPTEQEAAGESAAMPLEPPVPPVTDALPPPPPATTTTLSPGSDLLLDGGLDTALGGVLFLINVMLVLDLPDCFDADWHLARRLGPWGTLEALARALLDPATEQDRADPIWPALAGLAGRPADVRLGDGLPHRAPFRPPPDWPALPEPPVASRILPRSPLLSAIDPALGRWLACVAPAIRHRLTTALDASEEPEAVAALLRRHGRLHVTMTHVDLVLPLDAVSLPARIAGLDRDPGWLPAFGRVVLFHFD